MNNTLFKKNSSQLAKSIAKNGSLVRTSKLQLLVVAMFSLCFFYNSVEAQPNFTFTPGDFTVVNNSRNYVYEFMPAGYHQYNLVLGDSLSEFESVFMHHNTPLNLSVPFVFSAKFAYFPNYFPEITPKIHGDLTKDLHLFYITIILLGL